LPVPEDKGDDAMILVTGGAGFIGSNFVLDWLREHDEPIVNLDKLTYAGNLSNLATLAPDVRHRFVRADIGDRETVRKLLDDHRPRAVIHFAAESHVDRSIHGPGEFISTNLDGTFALLEEVRAYYGRLDAVQRDAFRFLHVSTDEVYGSLTLDAPAFTEESPYRPNSPYSASKAGSDHLVRAYHHTYGLPTLITNCSNNYGPYQFPEKLIPLMIHNALKGLPLPVYGDGSNVRDWLFVSDHCEAIRMVLGRGRPGETYNIGGSSERSNIEVVRTLCSILDELVPRAGSERYDALITFVKDRPGHDFRYAIDAGKIEQELGWRPRQTFSGGLQKTVDWYLANAEWVAAVADGRYREWLDTQYAVRR